MNPRTPFILVDRAAEGGFEIWWDGAPAVIYPKGTIEMTVWGDILPHIFTHDHVKVHTTDGQYVSRVAVKSAVGTPQADLDEVRTQFGDEALDDSMIAIDRTRHEGWDTRNVPDQDKRRFVPVSVPMDALREHMGNRGDRLSYQER